MSTPGSSHRPAAGFWIGFAVTEAIALFSLLVAIMLLFVV